MKKHIDVTCTNKKTLYAPQVDASAYN